MFYKKLKDAGVKCHIDGSDIRIYEGEHFIQEPIDMDDRKELFLKELRQILRRHGASLIADIVDFDNPRIFLLFPVTRGGEPIECEE